MVQLAMALLCLAAVCLAYAGDRGPIIPKGKGEQCVAETNFMRRNHMDLIVHQRDETVIRGIRDEPFSLSECVDCHAQRNPDQASADNTDSEQAFIRVDAEGQFCASCHTYVAAKIDCFGCHAAVPDAVNDAVHDQRADNVAPIPRHWLPKKSTLTFQQAGSSAVHTPENPHPIDKLLP